MSNTPHEPNHPEDDVAERTREVTEAEAQGAAERPLTAEALAAEAISGSESMVGPAAGGEAGRAVETSTAALQTGLGIAGPARGGDPSRIVQAAGSAAGLAGGAAGMAGGARAAQVGTAARVAAGAVSSLATAVGSLLGGTRLERPRFEFVLTRGPQITWVVRSFSCRAELSKIYEIDIELVCDDVAAPVDEMLGAPCELSVERGELLHTMYGIIDQLDDVGPDQDRLHVRARVIPAFALLAEQVDTRIFQGKTVIEILTEVLGATLAVYGRELDASTFIKREYHPRDYCTQFRESTLDFCCRLMEEEGIAFYFASDTGGRREKLVLIDNNNDYPEVELSDENEVPIIENDPEEADTESIRGLVWRQRRRINKVSGRAYNFKAADAFDEHEESVDETHNHHPQELYLHDLRRQITDDPVGDANAESFDGTGLLQRQRLVEQVLQEHRAQTKTGNGRGNVTGFHPGRRFRLVEHHRGDLDGSSFLLVRVIHSGEHDEAASSGGATYANEFTVIPLEHEFRPQQTTRRAKVYGPQLAVVVGLDDKDEIHTDQFGRVKIQFHHDRRQPRNATASCWVRVMQPWAGRGWGSFFIPRVGMEVVVQFVDGDPDQPVVVGAVYNSVNTLPYTMPEEKTKSTIKTSSTGGGGGYNELTFEDAEGSEQIIVHAQKDLNETVKNAHTMSVGATQSISVGGDRSVTVKKNETYTVEKDRTTSVKGGNDHLTVQTEWKLTVGNSTITVTDGKIEMTTGESTLTLDHSVVDLKSHDGGQVYLTNNALMKSSAWSKVKLDDNADLRASGNGQVYLTSDALMQSAGGSSVKLDGNATMTGATNATVVASSTSTLSAPTAQVLGDSAAKVATGGSSVQTSAAGVTASGPAVNVAGSGQVQISGGVVKIN